MKYSFNKKTILVSLIMLAIMVDSVFLGSALKTIEANDVDNNVQFQGYIYIL